MELCGISEEDLRMLRKNGPCGVRRRHVYRGEIDIPPRFHQGIIKHVFKNNKNIKDVSFIGYTSAKVRLDGRDVIFRCSSKYGGREDWYDWCLIQWETDDGNIAIFPGQILGFFRYETKDIVTDTEQVYAVIQSSNTPISNENLKRDFICDFFVDATVQGDLCVIPIGSIENTLFVFKNYGGSTKSYFSVLPRRHWSRYFGDRIERPR